MATWTVFTSLLLLEMLKGHHRVRHNTYGDCTAPKLSLALRLQKTNVWQNGGPGGRCRWAWSWAWPQVPSQTLSLSVRRIPNRSSEHHDLNMFYVMSFLFVCFSSSKNNISLILISHLIQALTNFVVFYSLSPPHLYNFFFRTRFKNGLVLDFCL